MKRFVNKMSGVSWVFSCRKTSSNARPASIITRVVSLTYVWWSVIRHVMISSFFECPLETFKQSTSLCGAHWHDMTWHNFPAQRSIKGTPLCQTLVTLEHASNGPPSCWNATFCASCTWRILRQFLEISVMSVNSRNVLILLKLTVRPLLYSQDLMVLVFKW